MKSNNPIIDLVNDQHQLKRTRILLIVGFGLCMEFIGCHNKKVVNYDGVLVHYKGDSLKYLAAKFLIDNIKDHYSVKNRYLTNDGEDYTNFIGTYPGKLSAVQVKDSLGVHLFTEKIPDTTQIDNDYLIKSVDDAFVSYNSIITAKRQHYSFKTFLNYVLPYRVGYEELNDWRFYDRLRYQAYLSTFRLNNMSVKKVYEIINAEQNGTSKFALIRKSHISRPSIDQTINEILNIRVPFDCEDYAVRSLYILRSLGIACAYERIPLWGKFNYGHVQESVMLENGSFYPILFGDTAPFKYQIAKMYRRTFEKQQNPYDEIRKIGEHSKDIPKYFNYSEYVDITKERTNVSDICLPNIQKINHNVLYLCIYNAGKWKPIEWSRIDKNNNSVVFKSMGRKILYCLGSFEDQRVQLINTPFILDTTGVVHMLLKNPKETVAPFISISNYDRNKPIKANHVYALYFWNSTDHKWMTKEKREATSSTLSFQGTFSDQLYKIEAVDDKSKDPVRPFTYNGKQIWW